MKPGDYVQLVHRIPRWPRKTRGTIIDVYPPWYKVRTPEGQVFDAHERDLTRLLRGSDLGR